MSISLLHPSRSRIAKSIATTSKWLAQSGEVDIELIVSVDIDDPELRAYVAHYKSEQLLINPNRSAIDAINNAAKIASGNILIVMSDDTDCPMNWGESVEYEMRGRHDLVLRVEDGIQSWLVTAPIMDRKYYERFGYVYFPDYRHMFSDTDFTHVAHILGKVKKSSLVFPHLHYSRRELRISPDEINHIADRTTTQGRNLYLQRFAMKFGFDVEWNYPWFVNDSEHLKWLKAHNVS